MNKALICGISGQDGAYLAQTLLGKGYAVFGTARDAQTGSRQRLSALEIRHRMTIEGFDLFSQRISWHE